MTDGRSQIQHPDSRVHSPDLLAGPRGHKPRRGRGHRQASSKHQASNGAIIRKAWGRQGCRQAWVTLGGGAPTRAPTRQPGTIPSSQQTKEVVADSRLAGAVCVASKSTRPRRQMCCAVLCCGCTKNMYQCPTQDPCPANSHQPHPCRPWCLELGPSPELSPPPSLSEHFVTSCPLGHHHHRGTTTSGPQAS